MSPPRQRIPTGGPPIDEREALEERRKRSIEEPLDVRMRQAAPYPILAVRNPLHGTEYLVLFPVYPSPDITICTCTDFARRGLGRCKHIEAATRWLDNPLHRRPIRTPASRSTAPVGLWKRIDRAVAGRESDPGPASLSWRRPGRLLFERSTA